MRAAQVPQADGEEATRSGESAGAQRKRKSEAAGLNSDAQVDSTGKCVSLFSKVRRSLSDGLCNGRTLM